MSNKCNWCKEHYIITNQKLKLCSRCTDLYNSNKYQPAYNLRKLQSGVITRNLR